MLGFTIDIAKKAGDVILSEKKKLHVEKKSRREIVTNADIAAEKFIFSSILSKYPKHEILGEESHDISQGFREHPDLWVVDPIDGTTNFAQGLADYGISIAYYRDMQPVVGVIYCPEKNMLFTGEAQKGAMLNGTKIEVSPKKDLKDAVLGSLFSYKIEENMLIFDVAQKLYQQIKTMRFLGSAVLDLSYTACGALDGTFGYALKPWDMAAGYLICREAGAVISTLKGRPWALFQKEILVSNKHFHPLLAEFFRQSLP